MLIKKQRTDKFAADRQTGRTVESKTETKWDNFAALLSVVYLTANVHSQYSLSS